MAAAAAVSLYLQLVVRWDSDRPRDFAYLMLVTVAVTTVVWLLVTWLTPPEPEETLSSFYRRVRPRGRGWAQVAARVGVLEGGGGSIPSQIANAALGCVLVYGALFGVGELLLGSRVRGAGWLAASVVAAYAIARNLQQQPGEAEELSEEINS